MIEYNFKEIKETLKKEFFGIDEQIDMVVSNLETWISIKDYQIRPLTVCLWGLTGTGKTALVNRAIELLELNKKKFYIKFGTKTSHLAYDFETNNCSDTIFILDEFQYFKTKNEDGNEIERDEDNSTNMIWELLDGGIINLYGYSSNAHYYRNSILKIIKILKEINEVGASLENGIVHLNNIGTLLSKYAIKKDTIEELTETLNEIENYHIYPRYDNNTKTHNSECVISEDKIRLLKIFVVGFGPVYEFSENRNSNLKFDTREEFMAFLYNCESLETIIDYLEDIVNSKTASETRNYEKSIIFIIGNLDECFGMSNDINSDLDADIFYNQTKKINILNIRRSLLSRFRPEQIARLGSTHIIYPSLNREAFKSIINKEILTFKDNILNKINDAENIIISNIIFSESILDLIYKEGVFPIIGARSIFSAVNEIIFDKFSFIVKNTLEYKKQGVRNILIDFNFYKKENKISINFLDQNKKVILTKDYKLSSKVDNLRFENNKGKQAHVAVHEAGHAVCSIALERIVPEIIHSVVIGEKNSGFNLMESDDLGFIKINTYMNRIATLLGGYAAEKMIFGVENISNGSGSDIHKATKLLNSLYKELGFTPNRIGSFISKNFTSTYLENANYSILDSENNIDKEVEKSMLEALKKAEETIESEMTLFIKLSEYLSSNPKIGKTKIKNLIKKYAKTITISEIYKNKYSIYTELLNQKIKSLKNEQ